MGEANAKAGSTRRNLTVFYSWQSDSPEKVNKSFVQDCLDEAVKKIKKEDAFVVRLDRDTKGEGGSPSIAETILKKIRSADVFVGDVTLTYAAPEPAPNPNVALEYGYALAALGENKIVAVMNTASGEPERLPFDLKHRRWPIQYSLSVADALAESGEMAQVKAQLTADLVLAIKGAAKEPRRTAFVSDVDLHIAGSLWKKLNPQWMANWSYTRKFREQYEDRSAREAIQAYVVDSSAPELRFEDDVLRAAHEAFVRALAEYLNVLARLMVPDPENADLFLLKVLREEWSEEYDRRFDEQAEALLRATEAVQAGWKGYVTELRKRYPEIAFGGA